MIGRTLIVERITVKVSTEFRTFLQIKGGRLHRTIIGRIKLNSNNKATGSAVRPIQMLCNKLAHCGFGDKALYAATCEYMQPLATWMERPKMRLSSVQLGRLSDYNVSSI